MTSHPAVNGRTAAPVAVEGTPVEPALLVDGLSVSYGRRYVLKEVGFPIVARSITAIIGPSGCGKSTCLLAITRLLDMVPGARAEGRVLLKGEDVLANGVAVPALRRRIGIVFQRPTPFPLSIERNISFPLKEHGLGNREERRERVREVLQAVGLWNEVHDRLDRSALSLSGGQQQRLCIARAIALEPEVLLLDEPTSALDPSSSQQVEELIEELSTRYAVAFVTHDLPQARRLASFAVFLFTNGDGIGVQVEYAGIRQLFEHPRDPRTADYVAGRHVRARRVRGEGPPAGGLARGEGQ